VNDTTQRRVYGIISSERGVCTLPPETTQALTKEDGKKMTQKNHRWASPSSMQQQQQQQQQ